MKTALMVIGGLIVVCLFPVPALTGALVIIVVMALTKIVSMVLPEEWLNKLYKALGDDKDEH